jgi:hypothetical protein
MIDGSVDHYIDKTIMEEEASETRQNAGIRQLRLLNYTCNNARHI